MEVITSLNNLMVKEAKSLNDKKFRKNLGLFLVDGEKLVREAVEGNAKITKIFVDEKKADNFSYILSKFQGKVIFVSSQVLSHISENDTPQGIIAEIEISGLKKIQNKSGNILILDRIQDPGNMGTIIRTAVATGFLDIILIDSADPFAPKVVRSSSGGIFNVNILKMTEQEAISYANEKGKKLLVADMNGKNLFKEKQSYSDVALVIGNEGQGVSQNFENLGEIISLPMRSEMESLNAGVSASVLMYILAGDKI